MHESFDDTAIRTKIIETARKLNTQKLSIGTSGNVSYRPAGKAWFLITPSGMPYETLRPEDIVKVYIKDGSEEGKHRASIESDLHRKVYEVAPNVCAIVHADAHYARLIQTDIGLYTHTVMAIGGTEIIRTPFAMPGSVELAENAAHVIGSGYKGCVLGMHGLIACDGVLDKAFVLAELIEDHAKSWFELNPTNDPCVIMPVIPNEHHPALLELFKTYGK